MVIMKTSNANPTVPPFAHFIIGGMAGIAGQTSTHPMDVLKIRMQVFKGTMNDAIRETMRTTGFRGFYTGLSAALLRQVTYTTTRLGVYTTLLDIGQQEFGQLSYPTMVSIGMVSGVIGAFVGTPSDLIMVRMIGDIKLPPEKRRNYRNALVGLIEVWKTEGATRLWRGALSTVGRAAVVNGTQLGTYSRAKILLKDSGYFQEGILLQFLSSMISGIVMCATSLPVDAIKTRIQSWDKPTKPPSVIQLMVSIIRTEGVGALWRGFLPYYARAGPNSVVTMITMDQLHRIYTEYMLSKN